MNAFFRESAYGILAMVVDHFVRDAEPGFDHCSTRRFKYNRFPTSVRFERSSESAGNPSRIAEPTQAHFSQSQDALIEMRFECPPIPREKSARPGP